MTLMEAAKKWDLSTNWLRELIKSGRLDAKLDKSGPVPFYNIPDGTPKPKSMQRSPMRKGTGKKIRPESIARREYRAQLAKAPKVKKAKTTSPRKKLKT